MAASFSLLKKARLLCQLRWLRDVTYGYVRSTPYAISLPRNRIFLSKLHPVAKLPLSTV